MRKTILVLALSLILTISMVFSVNASSNVSMGINDAHATPGTSVTLRVTLDSAVAVNNIGLYFEYDPNVLTLTSTSWLTAITSNGPAVKAEGDTPVVAFDGNKTVAGDILEATFLVNPNAPISNIPTVVTPVVNVTAAKGDTTFSEKVSVSVKAGNIYVRCTVDHSTIVDNDNDCTTAVQCPVCKAIVIPAAAGHVDANGDYKCDNCDYRFECIHPQTSTRVMIFAPATCTTPGSGITWVYCLVCGDNVNSFPLPLPATGHADADADGKCDACGEAMAPAHTHDLVHTEAKAATCTEDGNIEYWYCEGCNSYFTDAEGKNKVDAADVVVPAAHKVEHVEAKEATETEDGNIEHWRCSECGGIWLDADCTVAANPEDVVVPATGHVHNLVYTAAKEATCFEEGNLEYWYCEGCNCYFTDAEGKYNIAYLSLILPVSHDIVHVEAKEATCFEEGNIEHWYCTKCGYAWLDEFCTQNTNLKAVILPVAHKVEHVEAKAATCFEEGNIEYWYCTECGYAWLDELCTKNTNLLAVILPVSHKIVHVEAKAPTATEEGNIEYWYCTECGYAWLDELCTKNTNLKAVILPATGEEINPPTGDATILYIAAVAVIATLGVAVIRFKKREEN